MNFTAPAFVLLFPIVLALHWMLPPSRRWVLLLAASLGFYAVGSPQALPLLAGITLGTYAAALGIAKSKTQTAKKLWLTCAAVLCIGCLCLFKYAGIFRTDVPLLLPAGWKCWTKWMCCKVKRRSCNNSCKTIRRRKPPWNPGVISSLKV